LNLVWLFFRDPVSIITCFCHSVLSSRGWFLKVAGPRGRAADLNLSWTYIWCKARLGRSDPSSEP
jgi:hypothetical protein